MAQFKQFRDDLNIPLTDAQLEHPDTQSFVHPDNAKDMVRYIHDRRNALGGPIPQRVPASTKELITLPGDEVYGKFYGEVRKEASTTTGYAQLLAALMGVKGFGQRIVPIATDEHRTFGMESLFPRFKIHAPFGQRYTPVDADQLLSYKESPDGQMVQEGISEGGAMSTWIAAGTSYTSQGCPMLPFFIYYSMFGFQRVGDFIWQAADARARGFLIGATSGRTTLNGEGLQHQDGHSLLMAYTNPACRGWDPAFIYELSVIIEHGIEEMWGQEKDVIHYVSSGTRTLRTQRCPTA